MFGNFPWNLNRSVKRKIRDGLLPIPKRINNSVGRDLNRYGTSLQNSLASISESLPDTVLIRENGDETGYVDDSPAKCNLIPCATDTCSVRYPFIDAVNTSTHCELIVTTPKSSPSIETTIPVQLNDTVHSIPDESPTSVDFSLTQTVTLDGDDGRVVKLGCSDSDDRVLTVVQEKRVSFWECLPFSTPTFQSVWSKIASIPISETNDELVFQEESQNFHLHWVLSFNPSEWKAVALQINTNLSKGNLYAVDTYDQIRVECIHLPSSFLRNSRRIYTVLIDSTTFLLYYTLKESKGTKLIKYSLTDDLTSLVGLDFAEVKTNIESLHIVNACKPIIAGLDEEKVIHMWNHSTGNLIKRVDVFVSQTFSFIGVVEDEGYLFILAKYKPGIIHLLAYNICTKNWKFLRKYSSDFQGSVVGYSIIDGMLLAVHQEGLVVWDMQSEIQLTHALATGKCIPFALPGMTVFGTEDHKLFTFDHKHIFKGHSGAELSDDIGL